MLRRLMIALVTVAGVGALATPAVAQQAMVTVGGTVTTPAGYSAGQLAGMAQSTYPVTNPLPGAAASVTGTDVGALVNRSAPVVPAGKHSDLRVSITVTGQFHRQVRFALAELTDYSGHPAVLTPDDSLVLPSDRNRARTVRGVSSIQVAVTTAAPRMVPAGSILVVNGKRSVNLPLSLLRRLPQVSKSVTFATDAGTQTHTESGPSLQLALLFGGALPLPNTPVFAVGSDNYGAVVTPAEDYIGGRPQLLSITEDGKALDQPRLVPVGDAKGARYVSGLVTIYTN